MNNTNECLLGILITTVYDRVKACTRFQQTHSLQRLVRSLFVGVFGFFGGGSLDLRLRKWFRVRFKEM